MTVPPNAPLSTATGESLCPTCLRPLAPWPPPHEGYRGIAPLSPVSAASRGDRFTCRTALCNRYGFVVRVPPKEFSRAG